MEHRIIYTTLVVCLAAAQIPIPNALASVESGGAVLTIAGATQSCRCCMTQVGPAGILHICRECHFANCTCDFDAYGLPRCTGTDVLVD